MMQTQLDLSQTSGNYTLKLNWAEADSNRIALGFTLDPFLTNVRFSQLSLADAQGNRYRLLNGSGGETDAGAEEWSINFEPPTSSPLPDTLDLTLTVELAKTSDEDSGVASPAEAVSPTSLEEELRSIPANSERAAAIRTAIKRYATDIHSRVHFLFSAEQDEANGNQANTGGTEAVGSFTFSFSVPFTPARVARLNQTVATNGTALTLDRVVVSPSEAVAHLRLYNSEDSIIGLKATLFLTGLPIGLPLHMSSSGKDGTVVSYQGSLYEAVGTIVSYPGSLYEADGEWQISVTELTACDAAKVQEITFGEAMADGSLPEQARERALALMKIVSGPRVFSFTVPPAPKQSE